MLGVTDDNAINSFQIGYCTGAVTGTVDIKIGFAEVLAGFCSAGVPLTGHGSPLSSLMNAYFDFAGAGLPGATTVGATACWLITIGNFTFCMQSDGNGTWDNALASDLFIWTFQHENTSALTGGNGPIINGEPMNGRALLHLQHPLHLGPGVRQPLRHRLSG